MFSFHDRCLDLVDCTTLIISFHFHQSHRESKRLRRKQGIPRRIPPTGNPLSDLSIGRHGGSGGPLLATVVPYRETPDSPPLCVGYDRASIVAIYDTISVAGGRHATPVQSRAERACSQLRPSNGVNVTASPATSASALKLTLPDPACERGWGKRFT